MKPSMSLISVLCVAAASLAMGATSPEEVPIGQLLRPATLQGLNGPSRALSEFLGRPLIINVWASWCGPCRAEMASLERLRSIVLDKEFTDIRISTLYITLLAKSLVKNSQPKSIQIVVLC